MASSYEEVEEDCTELEGILRSINKVEKVGRKNYTTITIQKGKRKMKIEFPGTIFSDSIGNKVEYIKQAKAGPSTCGTPMRYGYDHYLIDSKNEREYHVYVHDPY